MQNTIQIIPIHHIPVIKQHDNLPQIIYKALEKQALKVENNDIFVITQKIVSKAEGRICNLSTISPSLFAKQLARQYKKDMRFIELVLRESKRLVRMDHGVIISETHHGFICANAGIDASNVEESDTVSLLPKDPNVSAGKIRQKLEEITKKRIAVIISDTWGRPWREGQVNFAIGSSGASVLTDYRGAEDTYGYPLKASMIATADEMAAAAELVMGKISNVPIAIIRGYLYDQSTENAKKLIRDPKIDMFR